MKTIWSIFLSIALAVTMMPAIGGLASPAFAGEDDAALQELADNMQHGNAAFNFTSEKSHKKGAMGSDGLPTKYDLRDLGYVTPVKSQSPYGTCWGFSAIAAAESSLLSSGIAKPEDMDETGTLNLSEKHLTYFAYQAIDDPKTVSSGRAGSLMKTPRETRCWTRMETPSTQDTSGCPITIRALLFPKHLNSTEAM